jgi:hypothetical protein
LQIVRRNRLRRLRLLLRAACAPRGARLNAGCGAGAVRRAAAG